jgi:hypothetical protein
MGFAVPLLAQSWTFCFVGCTTHHCSNDVPQDPRVVVSALMKLAGGSPSLAKELNVDAFLKQVRMFWHSTVHSRASVNGG